MPVSPNEYKKMGDSAVPPTKEWRNLCGAFLIGGAICALGQLLLNIYKCAGLGTPAASTLCSVSLIFLSAVLTALGIYYNIAKFGGGGTLVPITGFANAVVSPAMEFKTEGWVLGVGVKMFTIAGPVIVYGLSAGVVYGIIYWLLNMVLK